MNQNKRPYEVLSAYTLSLQDNNFIHQHVVDAETAQQASEETKTISIVFSLVGLYLHIEKNFTGREVQQFHMKMAKDKLEWPEIELPSERGGLSPADVLVCSSVGERVDMIRRWCEEVWCAYSMNSKTIEKLVEHYFSLGSQ